MQAPKSHEVSTPRLLVKFLGRLVVYINKQDTRIEQLEKSDKALKNQLAKLKKQNNEYNRCVEEYNDSIDKEVAESSAKETKDVTPEIDVTSTEDKGDSK